MSEPAGQRVFGGVALGFALLLLVDLAGLGLYLMAAAVLGGPEGDVGLVLYAGMSYLMMLPIFQFFTSAVAAAVLVATGRRPMAVGLAVGTVVTSLGCGGVVAYVLSTLG